MESLTSFLVLLLYKINIKPNVLKCDFKKGTHTGTERYLLRELIKRSLKTLQEVVLNADEISKVYNGLDPLKI
jgi:hypothetical protein